MEAKRVSELPRDDGWQFEPKWDGFRCLAWKDEGAVALCGKSGKSLARYFPEVTQALLALAIPRFCIDGELVIPLGRELSFDSLQQRLHPAETRIKKLSQATPALLIAFDCLMNARGTNLLQRPLTERRDALERLFAKVPSDSGLRLSPFTREYRQAQQWLDRSSSALDGVIAKPVDGVYRCGERAMLKVKPLQTADCVVGGFRYGAGTRQVGSLLLGLYDESARLHHVGFTSSIASADRAALTRRLQPLIEPPGFTGDAPGGPSRWSTERSAQWQPLRPTLVVEVLYDQVTDGRFRHGTRLLRWRPDKPAEQCTCDQLRPPARPSALIKRIVAGG
ncbi:ATP-dependent DNA ligase [Povalibacter sp.]|uniref:ATP-dependent DNA ligase n=1 Tax=Povalibacter sp. TaxID=1962978 RepID=UPI002F42D8CE